MAAKGIRNALPSPVLNMQPQHETLLQVFLHGILFPVNDDDDPGPRGQKTSFQLSGEIMSAVIKIENCGR